MFLDQCHVLCLYYIKNYSEYDLDCDQDDRTNLSENIRKEIESFTSNFDDIVKTSEHFAKSSSEYDISSVGKVVSSVKLIWHGDLTEENFNVAADSLFETEQLSSWNEIGLLLYLMYRTLRVRGITELLDIVNLTAKHLAKHAEEFVSSQNGWLCIEEDARAEESTDTTTEQEEILTSLVMVQQPTEDRDIPPTDSPPFSLLTPPAEEEEKDSLNSATPPEIIDRPPMTASLMQMMGAVEGGNGNTGASSDSTEFEMVASANNSASISCPSSPKDVSDDAALERSTDSAVNKHTLTSQLQSIAESNPDVVSEAQDTPPEGASVSDYLPQISLGVAAAAACIGFFVLKKATA